MKNLIVGGIIALILMNLAVIEVCESCQSCCPWCFPSPPATTTPQVYKPEIEIVTPDNYQVEVTSEDITNDMIIVNGRVDIETLSIFLPRKVTIIGRVYDANGLMIQEVQDYSTSGNNYYFELNFSHIEPKDVRLIKIIVEGPEYVPLRA